jgi:hypothetical protein
VSEALNNFVTSQNDTSEIMSLRVLTQVDLHKAVSAGVAGAPIALEVHLTSWATKRRTFQNERSLQIKAFFSSLLGTATNGRPVGDVLQTTSRAMFESPNYGEPT